MKILWALQLAGPWPLPAPSHLVLKKSGEQQLCVIAREVHKAQWLNTHVATHNDAADKRDDA